MLRFRKSALTALTTFAAMAAAVILVAPNATAQVWRVDVSAGSAIGLGTSQFGTGCSYSVTAEGRSGDSVWFYDLGAYGTFNPQSTTVGSNGRATTTWTPQATGWHRIWADSYYGSAGSGDIQVGTGINLGSACVVR